MCILVVALQCHPAFPFICAHNRDEERDRPTLEDGIWKPWLSVSDLSQHVADVCTMGAGLLPYLCVLSLVFPYGKLT